MYTFQGRQLDPETGLLQYRHRYYSPEQGRFISRDPLLYVDGLGLHEFVRGNPYSFVDPHGRAWAFLAPLAVRVGIWIVQKAIPAVIRAYKAYRTIDRVSKGRSDPAKSIVTAPLPTGIDKPQSLPEPTPIDTPDPLPDYPSIDEPEPLPDYPSFDIPEPLPEPPILDAPWPEIDPLPDCPCPQGPYLTGSGMIKSPNQRKTEELRNEARRSKYYIYNCQVAAGRLWEELGYHGQIIEIHPPEGHQLHPKNSLDAELTGEEEISWNIHYAVVINDRFFDIQFGEQGVSEEIYRKNFSNGNDISIKK